MSKSSHIQKHKQCSVVERSRLCSKLLLLPLMLIVSLIPIIVKMHTFSTNLTGYDWAPNQKYAVDFFLYYKQWCFVIISSVLIIIIGLRGVFDKKTLKFTKIFYPLFTYGTLSLISTIISKYRLFGFSGYIEQFENVFCIIGYVLVIYYCYLIIESEYELRLLINALAVGALLVGIFGTFQFLGFDYFNNKLFQSFIFQTGTDMSTLDFTFESNRVYSTLFNPNYVGVYFSLLIPLFTSLLFFSSKLYQYFLYSAVILTSSICLLGSQSKTGLLSIIFSVILLVIFLRKKLIRLWYIVIPIATLVVLSLSLYNLAMNNKLINSINNAFNIAKVEMPDLSLVNTSDQGVDITYKNNLLRISLNADHNLILSDSNNNIVEYIICDSIDSTGILVQPQDLRFSDILIANYVNDSAIDFCLFIKDDVLPFSTKAVPNTYTFYNQFEKFSPFLTAKSIDFRGYERFGTNRGFIWSRTIPLISNYILLGSGADSFAFAYPQYDYVYLKHFGFNNSIVSKPHNLYLQISIQSGLLSLIAFLSFFIIYIVQSLKLYFKCSFNDFKAQIGISTLIAIISFLFTGLSNDSSITVSPVFYTVVGIGIAANTMVKKSQVK